MIGKRAFNITNMMLIKHSYHNMNQFPNVFLDNWNLIIFFCWVDVIAIKSKLFLFDYDITLFIKFFLLMVYSGSPVVVPALSHHQISKHAPTNNPICCMQYDNTDKPLSTSLLSICIS